MLHEFFRLALRSAVRNFEERGTGGNNKKSLGSFQQGYETNNPGSPPNLHKPPLRSIPCPANA
jgi:hypothetical protein